MTRRLVAALFVIGFLLLGGASLSVSAAPVVGRVLDTAVPRAFAPFLQPSRYKGTWGGRGSGKCLGRGTRVMRYDGSLANVEDIKVGDLLMGPDSCPREVLVTTQGVGPLYRVIQSSAMSYVVNDAHILALKRSNNAKKDVGLISAAGNPQRPNGRYAKYGLDVSLISAGEYATQSSRFKELVNGYKVPVSFPTQPTEIDPYFLGLWLGDGNKNEVAVCTMEPEIVDAIKAFGSMHGFSLNIRQKPDNKASTYYLSNGWRRDGSSLGMFRNLDLLYNKHIPEHYIVNDERVRLELLAGLVDTDGNVTTGNVSIVQKLERLADDVKRLADSLGFKTSKKQITATCANSKKEDKTSQVFRVIIGGDINRIPCRVARKKAACLAVSKNKDWRRTHVEVEPIGEGEYFGFVLDGDHLFLLEDGTVTHNSHIFAELLLTRCVAKPGTRVVCVREVQRSLEQSVKRLLTDKIETFRLGDSFGVSNTQITTPGGGVVVFQGMQDHTADSIKSLEGFDVAWVEEAQTVSERSLTLLRPTIREPGSELWFTWNPRRNTDPVDKLLRGPDRPQDSVVVGTTYRDNPWFPDVLRIEMEWDRQRDPEKYAHVWLGEYERKSESRVFKNWRIEEFEAPADAVHLLGADWGFSIDPSTLVRCHVVGRTLYVDYEAYKIGVEIDHLGQLFDTVPGSREWPIVADSARPETISYLQRNGFPLMVSSKKGANSVIEGVQFLQNYDIVVHPRCKHAIDELTMYSFKTDKLTGLVTPLLEDKQNHIIDPLRYATEKLRAAVQEEYFSW